MSYILTLVAAAAPLATTHIKTVAAFLAQQQYESKAEHAWLSPQKAAYFTIAAPVSHEHMKALRTILSQDQIDVFISPRQNRCKKLLIADMDSTIVNGETLDELAAYAGLKEEISAITARAMNGELDFKAALRERVKSLRGLSEDKLFKTLEKTALNPGAEIFVQVMKQNGATCVLVSGGFSQFTAAFAEKAGFDHHHGNMLQIENGTLTGDVVEPILDKNSKLHLLKQYCREQKLAPDDVLAIGDGANDLPMLQAAGLGIGYHPKPLLEDKLINCIIHGDLTTALYAQGLQP